MLLCTLAIGCDKQVEQRRESSRSRQSVEVADSAPASMGRKENTGPNRDEAIWQNRIEPSFYAYIDDRGMNVNADGSMTLSSGPKGLWLHPDGRFARTAVGLSKGFDEFCRTANSCGQFEMQNGQFIWFYDSDSASDARTESISKSGNQLRVGEITYQYVAPVRDWRLNGNYQKVTGNIDASAPVTYFSRDGRLKVASADGRDRNGTYRINGYSLTYSFDDGETETHDFYIIEGRPYIDGVWYDLAE